MSTTYPSPPPMPDLTHLTEEERNIIQSVIDRQKACDAETSKLQRLLTREVETYQNKLELKSKDSSRANEDSHKESNVCELCHKTKLSDGVGKPCKYCKRRVCNRCGDDVSFPSKKQPSWVCLICKKKQELLLKTGGWFNPGESTNEATPAETIESLLNGREGRRLTRSNSLQEHSPVRLRSSLEKSNSFDQHDRGGAFTPRSPRMSPATRRLPITPRANQNGHNGYTSPRGPGPGTSPRTLASPRLAASPRLGGAVKLGFRPSLSDDDVESPPGSDGEEYQQDEPQESRAGGGLKNSHKKSVSFRDGHDEYRPTGLRGTRGVNTGDGQRQARDGSSIRWSRPDDDGKCLGVILLKRDLQNSFPDNDPYSVYGVKVVGGKMTENDKLGAFVTAVDEGSPADVVAGLMPGDEIIEWNEQSLVDCTFEDVLDAISNSQESPDLHLVVSRHKSKFPAKGQQGEDATHSNDNNNPNSQNNRKTTPYWSDNLNAEREDRLQNPNDLRDDYNASRSDTSHRNISGKIQVKLYYDQDGANLTVTIVSAEGLSTRGSAQQLPNPYSKVYLLPDRSMQSKRRTKTMTKTAAPRWSQSFVYPCRPQKFHGRSIEITVWDHNKSGESDFLGEVLIDMANANVDGSAVWYPLSSHDDSSSPLGPPTPIQSPSSSFRSSDGRTTTGPMIMINNERDPPDHAMAESPRKQYSDRLDSLPTQSNQAFSPPSRNTLSRDYQEDPNSGRISPTGSLPSGRLSPGAKKARTLPGLPSGNQPPTSRRRNSDSNVSSERHQAPLSNHPPPLSNHPPRAQSVTHRPHDRMYANESETVPNGRAAQEPGQSVLKDVGNNSGFIKPVKTGLKGELMGALPSGRSSRSSSFASDRSPTGSVGSITGSITSTESSPSVVQGRKIGAEQSLEDFIEGLGPAQMVGRQVLASPCMGDIQLSFYNRKGVFEVEVIRARGLLPKPGSKILPAPYVKVYVMENGKCLAKKKTRTARRTLEPLYQQQLEFRADVSTKTLQVIVWGDYGRMDRKVFMGVVQVLLSDLDLSSMTFGWYKLFSTSSMCEPPIFTPPTSPMNPHGQAITRQTSTSSIHSLPAPYRTRPIPPHMQKHASLNHLGPAHGPPRISRPRIEMIEDEGDFV